MKKTKQKIILPVNQKIKCSCGKCDDYFLVMTWPELEISIVLQCSNN